MKYIVEYSYEFKGSTEIEIDADSREEAEKKALKLAEDDADAKRLSSRFDCEIDGIYEAE